MSFNIVYSIDYDIKICDRLCISVFFSKVDQGNNN